MYLNVWLRPGPKLWKDVRDIIKHVSSEYDTYANVNVWKGPHITIIFLRFRVQKFQSIIKELSRICSEIKPFKIELDGTGRFMKMAENGKRNYVIYLKPKKNAKLRKLYIRIERNLRFCKDMNHPYNPHMTLAHNDLSKDNFYRAWKEFKGFKFKRVFTVREISASTKIKGKRTVIRIKLGK